MRSNSERTYWMTNDDWYRINKEKDCFELTDAAPERARKSFALWNTQDDQQHKRKRSLWKRIFHRGIKAIKKNDQGGFYGY